MVDLPVGGKLLGQVHGPVADIACVGFRGHELGLHNEMWRKSLIGLSLRQDGEMERWRNR